ncbi:MAG: site-specific integrase [Armatimonadetes bacterium]|nr:site-specific integrase [Armatimonadota bacterium]
MRKPPKAYPVKSRSGLWAAKGVDPITLRRKNYFGKSETEAAAKALSSFGISDDYCLFSFYSYTYLPTVNGRSENWLGQIGWAMDKYVLPEFGHRDIRELKRPELQLFFNRLNRSMKASSVAKLKIVFSGVLRLAMADELIPSNPLAFVRLPTPDRVVKTALSFYELQSLLGASGPLIKPFVILAGCAGLRLGEAVGVTRAAISRDGVLSVRQQVQQMKARCEVSPRLKTSNSYREIPIPKPMLEALLECGQVSDIWVCSDSKGGYIRPKNITRELRLACERAEVPVVSPHELRHTFISLMDNEVEAPRTVVMALAGHAAQSTTDGYSHVKNEQKLRHMGRFWTQMSTACSPEEWATKGKIAG